LILDRFGNAPAHPMRIATVVTLRVVVAVAEQTLVDVPCFG
jgi:hypothetical protein